MAGGDVWRGETDFVFTTPVGTPVDPRNFNREFGLLTAKAGQSPAEWWG
jgi:hypothetical protein